VTLIVAAAMFFTAGSVFGLASAVAWTFVRPQSRPRLLWGLLRRSPGLSLIAAVAFVPLSLAAAQLYYRDQRTESPAHERVPEAYQHETALYCGATHNTLFLTVLDVNLTDGTVKLRAAICLTPGVERLSNRRRTVFFNTLNPPAFWSHDFVVPSHHRLSRAPIDMGAFTLPAGGLAQKYPFDTVRLEGSWYLQEHPSKHPQRLPFARNLNLQVAVFRQATMFQWTTNGNKQAPFALVGERSAATRLFVISLLLLPVILFGALLVVIRADVDERVEKGLVTGVAAYMLAVLPIRLVLVPPELRGFTFVDYALGAEMATMVAATLIVIWAASVGRQRS
jgi:hypothetical protein